MNQETLRHWETPRWTDRNWSSQSPLHHGDVNRGQTTQTQRERSGWIPRRTKIQIRNIWNEALAARNGGWERERGPRTADGLAQRRLRGNWGQGGETRERGTDRHADRMLICLYADNKQITEMQWFSGLQYSCQQEKHGLWVLGLIDSVSLSDACKKGKGIRYRGLMLSKNKQLTESLGKKVMSFFWQPQRHTVFTIKHKDLTFNPVKWRVVNTLAEIHC